MNDEINEILEEIDNKIIPNEHWNKVKDYITNLQQENESLRAIIKEARECINNFNVFEKFSFPLMKKWEENQVKSSIDYEFKDTLKKDLLQILDKESENNEKDN